MPAKKNHQTPVANLTKAQAKVEHMRLALEIEGHDQHYYQDDAPKISDAEYDALRQRFNAIEARFPELSRPTRRRRKSAPRRRAASPKCAMRCRCCRSTMRSPMRT